MKTHINPEAANIDVGELTVRFDDTWGYVTYFGTRMQIEAEGIRPPGDKWPEGFGRCSWTSGGNYFALRRSRPEGAKGPRRQFIDCDFWDLRIEPEGDVDYADVIIRRKEKELRAIKMHRSAAGREASNKRAVQFFAARRDSAFQQFMASIPAISEVKRPQRGRPTKSRKPECEL
ncbi:hypothetical protein FHX57_002010 [Paraburkholderia tropica]|uniref:hypothetical protein n=1 Tax=Paraburkholderia tropica TaxID=92647 RepID=UPI001611959A|nr:hypothetical protein [Paraburkholderia tropica]MBB2999679.1 hypothetical protein [Paraburkholderia tropica]